MAYISRSQPWGAQEILENQKLAQNWHKVRHLREYLIRKYNYVLNDRREKEKGRMSALKRRHPPWLNYSRIF